MIHVLPQADHHRVQSVCSTLEQHLAVAAVIERTASGTIYVDDPARPAAAFVQTGHRFYLAGTPGNERFTQGLHRLFLEDIQPQALRAARPGMFVLYYAPGWEAGAEEAVRGTCPIADECVYLEWRALRCDWRALLPPEFALREVDRQLLSEDLQNLDALRAEMCSERASVDEFLARSIGVCVMRGAEIVGWCLSEYNTGARCEVGIETTAPHRRRGLATAMASALVERALERGITRIGWDAWASNAASIATALKVGFAQVHRYPIYYAWFDEVDNLSVHGNVCFRSGQYAAAVEWFERAFQSGRAAAWAYWVAACAYARLGRMEAACEALHGAVRRGFADLEGLRSSPHLAALRQTAGWDNLLADLERQVPQRGETG